MTHFPIDPKLLTSVRQVSSDYADQLVPICACRSLTKGTPVRCQVLFLNYILERELTHLDNWLIKKHRQVERLENIPFDELTQKQWQYQETLRADIKLIAAILITLENMRQAYLEETATMATELRTLRVQYGQAQQRIADLEHDLAKAEEQVELFFHLYQQTLKNPRQS